MTPITRLSAPAILALAIGGGVACSGGGWTAPLAVRIHCDKDVAALQPNLGTWHTISEGGGPQGLLLKDGDYFFIDDGLPVRYRASDGRSLTVTLTEWSAKIGDTTVAVALDKAGQDGRAWLKAATDRELAALRTLGADDEIDAETLPALKRLAAANPGLDLFLDSTAAYTQLLPMFKPRAVFVSEADLDAGSRKLLASHQQLELLLIDAREPGSFDFLALMPQLRSLVISEWRVKEAGPIPAGLAGLKALLVMEGSDLTDLTPLAAVSRVESLSLIGLPDLKDVAGLEKMTSLHTLLLWTEELDLTVLSGLTGLRWVGLPPGTGPDQFAAFVKAHPKLEILDMIGNEKVKDLTPLGGLKNLHGLILDGEFDNLTVLQTLTSLAFVGLSKDVWEKMPDQVAAVQKALPDALIVKLEPFCLGSGWILLLAPVPVGAWLIRRTRAARGSA